MSSVANCNRITIRAWKGCLVEAEFETKVINAEKNCYIKIVPKMFC